MLLSPPTRGSPCTPFQLQPLGSRPFLTCFPSCALAICDIECFDIFLDIYNHLQKKEFRHDKQKHSTANAQRMIDEAANIILSCMIARSL
jgi:hypothetical protein